MILVLILVLIFILKLYDMVGSAVYKYVTNSLVLWSAHYYRIQWSQASHILQNS